MRYWDWIDWVGLSLVVAAGFGLLMAVGAR